MNASRKVLSRLYKCTCVGKLFHASGSAAKKPRSPNFELTNILCPCGSHNFREQAKLNGLQAYVTVSATSPADWVNGVQVVTVAYVIVHERFCSSQSVQVKKFYGLGLIYM